MERMRSFRMYTLACIAIGGGLLVAHLASAEDSTGVKPPDSGQTQPAAEPPATGGKASAVQTDAERARQFFENGVKSAENGRQNEAIIAYVGALKLDPTLVPANINLGVIYYQQNQFDKSLDLFAAAVKQEPNNVTALTNLGKTQSRLKKYDEAEISFRAALQAEPGNAAVYKDLARVYREIDKYEPLLQTIDKCHELGSGDEDTWYLHGLALEKLKRDDEAISSYRKSLELDPKGYEPLSALGKLYLSRQNYAEAAASFKAAYEANTTKFRAYYNYCSAVETMNPSDFAGNIANWEQFVKIARNNPKAAKEVAQAQAHVKELSDAQAAAAEQ